MTMLVSLKYCGILIWFVNSRVKEVWPLLLTIDIGNTNIKFGAYDGDMLYFVSRMATDTSRKEDQYAIAIRDAFHIYNVSTDIIDGAIISSVVPKMTEYIHLAVKKLFGVDAMILDYELIKDDFEIAIRHPEESGADLIADCVAAKEFYETPCIIIDMGTATKVLVNDKDGRMIGGCIIPGVGVSLDALVNKAALLSAVRLETPKNVIGNSTITCIQSGVIYGAACMIDGLCERFEKELGYPCKTVATGGLAGGIIKNCKRDITIDLNLVLEGLRKIYEMKK